MKEYLFKKTALGLYEYTANIVNTTKGSTIVITYGIYDKTKVTHITEGGMKQLIALVKKRKQEGYKSAIDLGCDLTNLNYAEIWLLLPDYNTDTNNSFKSMKCQPFVGGKFKYGTPKRSAKGQPKINGNRSTIGWGMSQDGMFSKEKVIIKSHEGLIQHVPHVERIFTDIFAKCSKTIVFDGELYHKGSEVATISGAARNVNNPINKLLSYHCFDLAIPDIDQLTRLDLKHEILKKFEYPGTVHIQKHPSEHEFLDSIVVDVCDTDIHSDEEAMELRDLCLLHGYEGAVIREPEVIYKFGSRPVSMMKLKKPKYGQFEVVDVTIFGFEIERESDVGKGCKFVLKNDVTNALFEANPTGTVEQKLDYFKNKKKYIGTKITLKYYERTVTKLPLHANVMMDLYESNE